MSFEEVYELRVLGRSYLEFYFESRVAGVELDVLAVASCSAVRLPVRRHVDSVCTRDASAQLREKCVLPELMAPAPA